MKLCCFPLNPDDLPLALTVDQTAKVLQLGKSLVYEMVRSGQLRSLRVGRKIRIPRSALLEFLGCSA